MQPILTLESKKYAIKLDNFEGPLDLLCHLIDKNKMDIYDIKLSEITDQYIDYLKKMEEMDLDIASEFLVMASTLLYLKSKQLIPNAVEEQEELSEEELIKRIIEYKKYKDITKKLKENFEIYSNRQYKLTEDIELPKQKLEVEYDKNFIPDIYSKVDAITKNSLVTSKFIFSILLIYSIYWSVISLKLISYISILFLSIKWHNKSSGPSKFSSFSLYLVVSSDKIFCIFVTP